MSLPYGFPVLLFESKSKISSFIWKQIPIFSPNWVSFSTFSLDEEDAVKAPSLADAANSAAVLLLMIEK